MNALREHDASGPAARPDLARRILIVEDEPDVARALAMILEHSQVEMELSQDGADALERVCRFRPHVVLLDVKLPVVDGFQVFQTLRRDPTSRDVRVIFLTAHTPRGAFDMATELGAYACFQKPFQPEVLRAAVLDALGVAGSAGDKPSAPGVSKRRPARPHVALVSTDRIGDQVAAAVREAVGEDTIFAHHASAVTALREFRIAMPDVALVDLELRDLDGLSFLRLLKADFQLSWIPVIVLTASASWISSGVALDAGAEAHALKPLAHDELVRLVRDTYRARSPGSRPG